MANPYDFEPRKKVGVMSAPQPVPVCLPVDRSRTDGTSWCHCGQCNAMPTAIECVCCREVPAVAERLGLGNAQCIVQHDKFTAVCLTKDVLDAVLVLKSELLASHLEEPVSTR